MQYSSKSTKERQIERILAVIYQLSLNGKAEGRVDMNKLTLCKALHFSEGPYKNVSYARTNVTKTSLTTHEQESQLKYGVTSSKFIWASCACAHTAQLYWLRPSNSYPPPPPHLGSYTRALLVSQDRRHLFVTPSRRNGGILSLGSVVIQQRRFRIGLLLLQGVKMSYQLLLRRCVECVGL